jgi:protocatechuate 3,4-dioxygenase beta subunit
VACLLSLVSCGEPSKDNASANEHTASIEGAIREAGSDVPIAGASVFLVRTSDLPQVRTTTDTEGRFSLQGLNAGRHLVALVREGYVVPGRQEISGYPFRVTAGEHIQNALFHMIPAGTVAGRVFHQDGTPANRVEVQLLQNLYLMGKQQWSVVNRGGTSRATRIETNEHGQFRAAGVDPGWYAIRLVSRELTVESRIPGGVSPVPMLYPGVRDISKAELVEVKQGRETLLNDIKLKDERRSWIRVTIVNESGEPLEGFGSWIVKPADWVGSEYPLFEDRIVNEVREIQPDAPGAYDIIATWPSPSGRLTGTARVQYRGESVELKIPIRKGQTRLTGHVLMQDAEGATRPVAGAEVAIGPKVSYFARSGPDGTLLLPEVYAGRYQLGFVRGLPADTFVMSARQGSKDVLKDEIVVEGDETNIEIVVSAGAAVLEGKVTDAGGRPVHNGLVALIPEAPLKGRKDYYGAYQETRTDQNGEFEVKGITPGEYQAYAWSDAPASAFRNAEFMRRFEGKGTPITLALSGKEHLDLQIVN